MGIEATAKSKIYIAGASTAATVEDYDAETFVQIKGVEDLGEFGDLAEEVTFATIEDARNRKLKGILDAGTLELIVGRDGGDLGQQALLAASRTESAYAFKVETRSGAEMFFRGAVLGYKTNFGTGSDVVRRTFTISIVSEILEVEPEPAAA